MSTNTETTSTTTAERLSLADAAERLGVPADDLFAAIRDAALEAETPTARD